MALWEATEDELHEGGLTWSVGPYTIEVSPETCNEVSLGCTSGAFTAILGKASFPTRVVVTGQIA